MNASEHSLHVGLCFDLRQEYLDRGYSLEETAEFDRPDTILAIENTLRELGCSTERIGSGQALVQALAVGRRWDLVFNIAEGLYGLGREAMVPALLEAWRIPYVFSDPLTLTLSLHKGMTKRVIRDLGLPTPAFAVLEGPEDLDGPDLAALRYPLFAKPLAEGTGKGVDGASCCAEPQRLARTCQALWTRFRQPVLVEEYLPGREFTVGLVGNGPEARVLGVMEVLLLTDVEQGAYGALNKEECERLVSYRLVDDPQARRAAEVALAAYRGLGVRDGARLDLRAAADGEVHFIEANPLAGLHPEHSDLPIICNLAGIPYRELLGAIMAAACARQGLAWSPSTEPLALVG